jgi:hypothetical protein
MLCGRLYHTHEKVGTLPITLAGNWLSSSQEKTILSLIVMNFLHKREEYIA